ncbi:glycoside hydrolase family 43 protein [Luteolibacter sp. LG18]|uniref:glycoside hydrolase family 43 protein n=1 Tax=Luteolibacter sp. LG18 TaxID=2819286 RepID=UPI002B2A911F|nr:glycosyl hydrolase family 43 [Luteolibacter sp. LG18]
MLSVSAKESAPASAAPVTKFRPGAVWPDTTGKPINAHGGGLLYHEGTYYWYGEIKQGETYLPKVNASWGGTRVDVVGVSCYSSKDLLNWEPRGNVLPAVPGTDLDPKKVLERPKVVYNAKTRKFVLWFHADSVDYAAAACGVATSDSPTGPFTYIRSFRPNIQSWPVNLKEGEKDAKGSQLVKDFPVGQMSRDMTVFVDDDGKAYLFSASEGNPTMHISELTDDYLGTTGKFLRIFEGRSMEAPAVFKRNGKYHLIASGCTAWEPNAARSCIADSIWGPWKELGNPCKGDKAGITFQSQGTYVLPVADKPGSFIFMADRWNKDNLADSRYIWLPIEFDDKNAPVIRWQDEWR